MNIFFILPKPLYSDISYPIYLHAGVAYLASAVKRRGAKVKIFDLNLGYSLDDAFDEIARFRADVVGITIYSHGYGASYRIIEELKKKIGIPVIAGGPHVSAVGSKVLSDTAADFGVSGEGEETLAEFIDLLKRGGGDWSSVRGLLWRDGGKVIENEPRPFIKNLDEIPFPSYEDFELGRYFASLKKRAVPLITSRGCPYRCNFCSVALSMGSGFRQRTPPNILREIEQWAARGIDHFDINDDCFTLDMKNAEAFCDALIERGINIKYQLYNGIRLDRINERLLAKMKASGCEFIAYSIESGNDEILKEIKNGITVLKAKEAVLATKKAGIKNAVNFIVGHPEETYEKAMDSVALAKRLPTNFVSFYNLIPYPGTALYAWIKGHGAFLYPDDYYLNHISYMHNTPVFETKGFTCQERKKVLQKGFLLHRKTILKFKFGPLFGGILFFVLKAEAAWGWGLRIYSYYRKRAARERQD